MKRSVGVCGLLILLVLSGNGCTRKTESADAYLAITRPQMGTMVTIKVPPHQAPVAEKAFAEIDRLESLLSKYKPDSDVSRISAKAGGGLVNVSPETLHVIKVALQVYHESGGAFDITVGPLLDVWKRCAKEQKKPDPRELARVRERVGSDKIILKENPPRVGLAVQGMEIDLSAIAKGYAVDRAVAVLRAHGVTSALVNAGGDIRVIGGKEGAPWRVGIQDPRFPDQPKVVETLNLKNWSVATSGNYRRFYEINGHRYSHIVDPRTGKPACAADSVTVLAPDATTSDAWATALSVLGAEQGIKTTESLPNIECMMIHVVNGELHRVASHGFDKFVAARIHYVRKNNRTLSKTPTSK